jgi:DNA-binding transcriptional ArsR family regulator
MSDQTEALTRLLHKFITELLDKLPRAEVSDLRREVTALEARLVRLEAALERVSPGLVQAKADRRVKRVTLKDRVVRLVESRPEGIRTSQIAKVLGVAQANVSHALRQATEESLIAKEKRGLYLPKQSAATPEA